MKRLLTTCFIAIACLNITYGQTGAQRLSLSLSTGYARQDLKWSIAGNLSGNSPNIYSELQWKKVGGQSINAGLEWKVWSRLLVAADYSHVFIHNGSVTDNDYNGNNQTDIAYDERFNADKGYLKDWSAAAGYKLIKDTKLGLNVFAGYGTSTQSLYILDRTGNFPDLNSTYKANWKGPFVKAALELSLSPRLSLTGALTYNQVNYNATADWNLIQSFQHPISYRHTAKGFGVNGDLSVKYKFNKRIAIEAGGGYCTWQTGKGIDELFLNSGTSDKTQLNKAARNGYRLKAGLIFSL